MQNNQKNTPIDSPIKAANKTANARQRINDVVTLNSYEATGRYFLQVWDKRTFGSLESVYVAFVDRDLRPIKVKQVALGNAFEVTFSVNEILYMAYGCGADGIILAHNHPSGNMNPSPADVETTAELYRKCECMGIKLHEHMILGPGSSYTSFAMKGYFDEWEKLNTYATNITKAGSFENTVVTLVNRTFDKLKRQANAGIVFKDLQASLDKVYVKYFDPII